MSQKDIKVEIKNLIVENLGVQSGIKKVEKISKTGCLVEMNYFDDKIKILNNIQKLKIREKAIYIKNDFSLKE